MVVPRTRGRRRARRARAPALVTRVVLVVMVVVVLVVAVTVTVAAAPASARVAAARAAPTGRAGGRPPPHLPPVVGEVLDGFRPPATPFGPGNRGVDYRVAPGTPVRASADGVVAFAGQVGGALHVTLLDDGGLRITASFLAAVQAHAGDRVRQGDVLGFTGDVVHVGVRDPTDAYLDPLAVFAATEPARVHLVPSGDDGATAEDDDAGPERPWLLAVVAERWPSLDAVVGGLRGPARAVTRVVDRARGMAGYVASGLASRLRLFAHTLSESQLVTHLGRVKRGLKDWLATREDCTPREEPAPRLTSRRIVVEVAGIGSTSESAAVDEVRTAELGVAPSDVVRFSYNGGIVPRAPPGAPALPPGPTLPALPTAPSWPALPAAPPSTTNPSVPAVPTGSGVPAVPVGASGGGVVVPATVPVRAYDERDSQQDLFFEGRQLRVLLDELAAANPGVPIDVVAHSQGGIVARLALEDRRASGRPPTVRHLVTLGSPHEGADLADAVVAADGTPHGRVLLRELPDLIGLALDPDLPSGPELASTSTVIEFLRSHPPPDDVSVTSIAARGDLIVPAGRTHLAGADVRTTTVALAGAHAHEQLPGSDDATRELALALADLEPTCRELGSVLADLFLSETISWVESVAALGMGQL